MNFPEVVVQYMLLHVSNDQYAGQRKREGKEKVEKHGTKRSEEGELDRPGSASGHDLLNDVSWEYCAWGSSEAITAT